MHSEPRTASAPAMPSVRWQLWIVAIGFFMQSLDTTIVIDLLKHKDLINQYINLKNIFFIVHLLC